jgi:hypothetical protein
MNILRHKSTPERVLDTVTALAASDGVRRGARWVAGLVGGAATATAVSAAVSSARNKEGR